MARARSVAVALAALFAAAAAVGFALADEPAGRTPMPVFRRARATIACATPPSCAATTW